MKKLTARCIHIKQLTQNDIQVMFELFGDYYANVQLEQFQKDLFAKDYVFLLCCAQSKEIKGFSTIVSVESELNQKTVRGFFSGDTVVHKDYWGQGTLGVAFLKFLFLQKLRRPLEPLYWFLISKGYKTYLLMANNFAWHYPRYERVTPANVQSLVDGFAAQLYPQSYDQSRGIIKGVNLDSKDHLKSHIAPIGDTLLRSNPRVAFFQDQNPNWQHGEELACLAEMTLGMPFKYQAKFLWRKVQKILPNWQGSKLKQNEDAAG